MTDLLSTEKRKVTAVNILPGGAKRRTDPLSVDSNLPAEIILGQGSRVMMTANVDVDDGLVNGVMGTVVKIIEGSKPLGQPQAVCVLFDDERVWANSRLQNPPPQDVDPKSVVVQGHKEPLNHGGHKYTRHQLPLQLAWACTIHKVQGMTLPEIVVSLDDIFKAGMGYVALSRVTSLSGLYLKDFNEKYIYCDKYIDSELQEMHQIMLKDTLPLLHHPSTFVNIIYHNVQGLSAKFRDIISNTQMMLADCICISETWLTEGQLNPEIPCFTMDWCHRSSGEKGGVAMYIKDHLSYQKVMLTVQGIEALALKIPALDLVVCVLYRPPRMTKAMFQWKLDTILDQLV